MNFLVNAWYKKSSWLVLLKPLSGIYGLIYRDRRFQYETGRKEVYKSKLPVIIIGNISVGGTGKTPIIIALAKQLKAAGFKPGIVSRGYKSKAESYPFIVTPTSTAQESGDEALLIAQNTQCPVVIDARRVKALKVLENDFNCDVVLSDDGLQHYAMGRDIEIAVIDGPRGFGNACLLPEGPLREKPQRLDEVDYIICNGPTELELPSNTVSMSLETTNLCNMKTLEERPFTPEHSAMLGKVHALAGIGNPERFFNSLCSGGFDIISHIFSDHHAFTKDDITFNDQLNVVMTEKDAIKCGAIATDKHWFLKVEAVLEKAFFDKLLNQLKALPHAAVKD